MPRALWKGAISFGLVHIPVALYPGARENRIDFDWLDRRDMKPVGYKRVNKASGREVAKDDIVKGVEVGTGEYVVLSDEEIRSALPQTTQTVEILAFVDAGEIAPAYFDRPYLLAPTGRGEKVYVLLRDALKKSGKVGVARVVIQTQQHLAALIPDGDALRLNTLRWADELRAADELGLPGSGKNTAPAPRDLQMALQLIGELSTDWNPTRYEDRFRKDINALVDRKRDRGDVSEVAPIETPGAEAGAEVIDLSELLKRSLKKPRAAAEARPRPARKRATPAAAQEPAKKARSRRKAA